MNEQSPESNLKIESKCRLSDLIVSPSLQALFGTELKSNNRTISFGKFTCCQGTGVVESEGLSHCCGLIPRINKSKHHIEEIITRNDDIDLNSLHQLKLLEEDHNALKEIASGSFFTGMKINHLDSLSLRKRLFSVALAANWRFGLKVKLVQLGKTENIFDYYKESSKFVMVLDATHLSQKEAHVKDFVAIVDHCYNGLIPIWVGMPIIKKRKGRLKSYQKRVSSILGSSIDQLIPQATLERLAYLKNNS